MMKYPNLEAERARKGMTKGALCKAAGVTLTAYARWQDGTNSPNIDKAKKIADLLGHSIEYLFREAEL